MVVAPPNFRGDLKILDQNNCGRPEQQIKFGRELNLRGGAKILGGPMNPHDAMVVVLKDILLCFLGVRLIYIVYIS